jgi:hypothetical protein
MLSEKELKDHTIDAATRRFRRERSMLDGATPSAVAEIRIAARLECLDADPLEWWDGGMLCALSFIEHTIESLGRQHQDKYLKVEDVQAMIAAVRQPVIMHCLHGFYLPGKPGANSNSGPLLPFACPVRFRYRCKKL